MSRSKKIVLFISIIILILGSYSLGFWAGKKTYLSGAGFTPRIINKEYSPSEIDFSLFWHVWDLVKEKYVGPIDYQKMFYGAISGMVNALGDPYTAFMNPEEAQTFTNEMKGTFEGIGAEVGIKNNQLLIIAPLEDSPAKKAGLLSGDKILKINGQDTTGLSLSEAVSKIRGPKGTEVKLLISREGFSEPKEFTIVRDLIKVKSVSWEMKNSEIAYIRLRSFDENSANEFKDAATEILAKNPRGIILDLRDNPGGYLDSSVEIASEFIPKGVIVYEKFKDGRKKEYKATGNATLEKFKLVVLINKGSASASEIVAGAIKDYRRGTLVGEQTFGKGSVQDLDELKGGAAIRITIAWWLTPSGRSINEEGIKPDMVVKMTEKDYNQNRDPQLDKALELLK